MLSSLDWQWLDTDYVMAKRLRFLLANLYDFPVDVAARDYLLQANEDEKDIWFAVQQTFWQTQGQHPQLAALAGKAFLEYQIEQAYEAGRVCAQDLLPAQLIARGTELRYSKNPYWQKKTIPESVQQAWSDGFQSYLELVREESW